ncbi:UPF0280 family protein [Desulfovibrio litoralis]|uniref:Uncharacterized protein n=1 Tax=Desulfovibrio litoralis DSM 11393 TaxID=1121455 RepID=A0A1M7T626_9BACT|nr:UPF0280 family protein [Desulfovibrio litoralis]SHN66062.1 hypothetical protein SAMN02745728_01572 [Desulfovibrio litoralis DSM 11393]
MCQKRDYRSLSGKNAEFKFQVVVEETDLWVSLGGLRPKFLEAGLFLAQTKCEQLVAQRVLELRAEIQNTILLQPEFKTSLVPVVLGFDGSDLIKEMTSASTIMQVGPMASVAGAIAEAVARGLHQYFTEVLVENGGDTFMYCEKEQTVALLTDPAEQASIGVLVNPCDSPVSFCASSGKFGHSLSFGKSDLAVIRAKNGALADAAATAVGNRLKKAKDVNSVLAYVQILQNRGLEGVFVLCDGKIGVWGNMELVAL